MGTANKEMKSDYDGYQHRAFVAEMLSIATEPESVDREMNDTLWF